MLRLHRVADAGHDPGELVARVDGLEVHAAAHADVARPAQHDRGFGVDRREVSSAQRMKPPFHGASVNGGGSTSTRRCRRRASVHSWTSSPSRQSRGRTTGRRRDRARRRTGRRSRAACGVGHAQPGEVELVGALLMRVGDRARPRCTGPTAPCPRARAGSPGIGTVVHGQRRASIATSRRRRRAVVGQGDLEMVEVVLEPAPDGGLVDTDHPDATPVGEGTIAGADDGAMSESVTTATRPRRSGHGLQTREQAGRSTWTHDATPSTRVSGPTGGAGPIPARARMAAMTAPFESNVPRHDIPRGAERLRARRRATGALPRVGSRRRPAVVCLHGGGQTAYMWEELGAALGGDRTTCWRRTCRCTATATRWRTCPASRSPRRSRRCSRSSASTVRCSSGRRSAGSSR